MPERSPHRLPAALALSVAALLLVGCADDGGDAAPPTTAAAAGIETAADGAVEPASSPGRLYVQRGTGGASDVDGSGSGTLTLTDVDADTVWFQDRPGRDAGRMTTQEFVDGWDAAGFGDDPPNAAVEIRTPSGTTASHVVELSRPRWDPDVRTLTYDVAVLDGGGEALPAEFGPASLFIDDGGGGSSSTRLSLSISDAEPGQTLTVELGATGGGSVAFSSGQGLGGDTDGLQVQVRSGDLPLTDLELTDEVLRVETSPGEGGPSAELDVDLYLVATGGISEFTLSSSAPGVEITAAVGDAEPEVVNQSPTLFAWPDS